MILIRPTAVESFSFKYQILHYGAYLKQLLYDADFYNLYLDYRYSFLTEF